MILNAHILLHLYLISIFPDCLSIMNTKSRIERDSLAKSKRRLKSRLFGKFEEDAYETFLGMQRL